MHVLHVHVLLREFFDVLSVIAHRGSSVCFPVVPKKEASSEASFIFYRKDFSHENHCPNFCGDQPDQAANVTILDSSTVPPDTTNQTKKESQNYEKACQLDSCIRICRQRRHRPVRLLEAGAHHCCHSQRHHQRSPRTAPPPGKRPHHPERGEPASPPPSGISTPTLRTSPSRRWKRRSCPMSSRMWITP